MIETFPQDSPFILKDSRQRRWAVPYHYEALNCRIENLIINNSHAIKSKDVLDLGCHFGTFSYACLRHGATSVHGVDSEKNLIENAVSLFNEGGIPGEKYTFFESDVESFLRNADDKRYDTILCLGLLYYCPDPVNILRLMKRAAKKYIIIDTFTAYYSVSVLKEGEQILRNIKDSTFDLPLVVYPITQSRKGDYSLQHYFLSKSKKKLSLLALPTIAALENFFTLTGFKYSRLSWERYIQNSYTWKDFIRREVKEASHWADVYHTGIRVSYLLEKV